MTDTIDLDGDGIADANYTLLDNNGDGSIDTEIIEIDSDGDGFVDTSISSYDFDGDGIVDAVRIDQDLDGDGSADVSTLSMDLDGDGIADVEEVTVDLDGDGVADIFESNPANAPIWEPEQGTPSDLESGNSLDVFNGTYDDLYFSGYNELYEMHGTPLEDMDLWDPQDGPMSCAVATTNMMFRAVGITDVGEAQIANVFENAGIYDPSMGTAIDLIDDEINSMAREMGLDIHAVEFDDFTPDSLADMLAQGIRPLVGVDSSELYDPETKTLNDLGLIPDSGHAVQVTGIISGPDGDYVIINDPGFPDGAGQQIPMDQFMDAAEDFGFRGVAVMAGAPPDDSYEFPWVRMAIMAGVAATSLLPSNNIATEKKK